MSSVLTYQNKINCAHLCCHIHKYMIYEVIVMFVEIISTFTWCQSLAELNDKSLGHR